MFTPKWIVQEATNSWVQGFVFKPCEEDRRKLCLDNFYTALAAHYTIIQSMTVTIQPSRFEYLANNHLEPECDRGHQ